MWNKTLAASSVECNQQLYYTGENDPPVVEEILLESSFPETQILDPLEEDGRRMMRGCILTGKR